MAGPIPGMAPGTPGDPAARGDSLPATHGGLSWTWEFDLDAVLAAVTNAAPWQRTAADPAGAEDADADATSGSAAAEEASAQAVTADEADGDDGDAEKEPDPEADEAEYQEALAAGRVRTIPVELIAGRIAETLPTGPGLAAWLGQARPAGLE
ncbi:MAG: hypothetical protein ACTHJW_10815, partial [Streptosporangiaceae bacterium]